MPPIIVKVKTALRLSAWFVFGAPKDTICTYQEDAWMEDTLGQTWFKDIGLPNCGDIKQCLMLNGHGSHESLRLQLWRVFTASHSHTTYRTQPLDVSLWNVMFQSYVADYWESYRQTVVIRAFSLRHITGLSLTRTSSVVSGKQGYTLITQRPFQWNLLSRQNHLTSCW